MKIKMGVPFVAFFFVFIFFSNSFSSENWKEEFRLNGVSILTRPVDGCAMKEFKAIGIIEAPIETIFNIFKDEKALSKWFGMCSFNKILDISGNNHIVMYAVLDFPFPLNDRDTIADIFYTYDQAAGKLSLRLDSIEEENEKDFLKISSFNNNCIRIKKISCELSLKKLSDEKTHMVYQAHVNPGLDVPVWLLNKLVLIQPLETIKGLRKFSTKKKYARRISINEKKSPIYPVIN